VKRHHAGGWGLDDKQLTPRNVLSADFPGPRTTCSIRRKSIWNRRTRRTSASPTSTRSIARSCARAERNGFDDLLLEAMRRLLKIRDCGFANYNRRFQYILVDEYQDTNRPQYELMRLLAGIGHNVCAVGDEDQSIIRGAARTFENSRRFERDFPEAKDCAAGAELPLPRRTSSGRRRRWWRTTSGAKARICGPRGRAGRRLDTTEAPDGENEALFAPTLSTATCSRQSRAAENVRAAVLYRYEFASRELFRRSHAPLPVEVSRGRRILVLRAGRDQGHDLVPEGDSESR